MSMTKAKKEFLSHIIDGLSLTACTTCEGSGTIDIAYGDWDPVDGQSMKKGPCPECKGFGQVPSIGPQGKERVPWMMKSAQLFFAYVEDWNDVDQVDDQVDS